MSKQVPFGKDGNMMGCDWYGAEKYLDIATTFVTTMKYIGYSRGRSSIKLIFIDIQTEKRYEMFMSEFDRLMKEGAFCDSTISGKFGFHKKGANYGIQYID